VRWDEFVDAIGDLADAGQTTHFVMSHADRTVIERDGKVIVERLGAGDRGLQFWVQRPHARGSGFRIREEDFGGGETLHRDGEFHGLRFSVRGGAPTFLLERRHEMPPDFQERPYEPEKQLQCSFCGKPEPLVERLITGPGVYICDECVALCVQILEDESRAGSP